MRVAIKFLSLLNASEKKAFTTIIFASAIVASAEALSVFSVMPFMAVLVDNENINRSQVLLYLYKNINMASHEEFLIFLGFLVFVFLVLSLMLNAVATYLRLKFILTREASFGKRIAMNYLYKDFSWHLKNNSAEHSKTILSEVNVVINNVALPVVNLVSHSFVALFILGLLIFIDIKIALACVLIMGGGYTLTYLIIKPSLENIGSIRARANSIRFSSLSEAFRAIKEIKFYQLEKFYLEKFSIASVKYAKAQAQSQILSQLPRFAIEAIAFGGLMALTIFLLKSSKNFNELLPLMALFAFAGYRLMPALQQTYGAIALLRYSSQALDSISDGLSKASLQIQHYPKINTQKSFDFVKKINISSINFSYSKTEEPILNNLSLKLMSGDKIAILGPSGSGKSTFLDIFLGLQKPDKGNLVFLNKKNKEIKPIEIKKQIAYVPQFGFLFDDTVEKNIALGTLQNDICHDTLRQAMKLAQLEEVVSTLPKGTKTILGESGSRLSGGQRQRILIARAMYSKPNILVLDEATSALDQKTERLVMKALISLDKLTLIVVTHRIESLSNLFKCYTLSKNGFKLKPNTFQKDKIEYLKGD